MFLRVFRDADGSLRRIRAYEEEGIIAAQFADEADRINAARQPDPETDELPPKIDVDQVDIEAYRVVDRDGELSLELVVPKRVTRTETVEKVIL